jgi:hypothetical protein
MVLCLCPSPQKPYAAVMPSEFAVWWLCHCISSFRQGISSRIGQAASKYDTPQAFLAI